MKSIAKTTQAINLIDPMTRELVEETPHVLTWTQFLEARTGKGQIKILAANLPDEALDEEFQEYLKDSEDETLAVAAFEALYREEEVDEARVALEAKAVEFGVKFKSNISNEKLIERVADAEALAADAEALAADTTGG